MVNTTPRLQICLFSSFCFVLFIEHIHTQGEGEGERLVHSVSMLIITERIYRIVLLFGMQLCLCVFCSNCLYFVVSKYATSYRMNILFGLICTHLALFIMWHTTHGSIRVLCMRGCLAFCELQYLNKRWNERIIHDSGILPNLLQYLCVFVCVSSLSFFLSVCVCIARFSPIFLSIQLHFESLSIIICVYIHVNYTWDTCKLRQNGFRLQKLSGFTTAHELIVSFEILNWVHSCCNYIDVKRSIDKHQETNTQHIVYRIHNYIHTESDTYISKCRCNRVAATAAVVVVFVLVTTSTAAAAIVAVASVNANGYVHDSISMPLSQCIIIILLHRHYLCLASRTNCCCSR